jgi:hypothetical protein
MEASGTAYHTYIRYKAINTVPVPYRDASTTHNRNARKNANES